MPASPVPSPVRRRSSVRSSRPPSRSSSTGTVTGVSVIQLLPGGIPPGLPCVAMLMIMTGYLAIRRRYPAASAGRPGAVAGLRRRCRPSRAGDPGDRRHVGRLLHADRDRLGDGGLACRWLISGCSTATLTWKGLLACRSRPSASRASPDHRGGRGAVRLDSLGRGRACRRSPWRCCRSPKDPTVLLLLVNLLCWWWACSSDSTTAILHRPIIAKPLVAAGVDPVASGHGGGVQPDDRPFAHPPMGLALFLVSTSPRCR